MVSVGDLYIICIYALQNNIILIGLLAPGIDIYKGVFWKKKQTLWIWASKEPEKVLKISEGYIQHSSYIEECSEKKKQLTDHLNSQSKF